MTEIETEYTTVVEEGNVVRKSGRHNNRSGCDCEFDAKLGQYRDTVIDYKGKRYKFYHNTPIVIGLEDGRVRLENGGWKTWSTKSRIKEFTPKWIDLYQSDECWYVETDADTFVFKNGMVLEKGNKEFEVMI